MQDEQTKDQPQDEPTQEGQDQTVQLKTGVAVHLTGIERDDEIAVIGTNKSGKRAIILREQVAEPDGDYTAPSAQEPIPPGRHRFRVYLKTGEVIYIYDPPFGEIEQFVLGEGEDTIYVLMENGYRRTLSRSEVQSTLSATPEDQAAAEANAN